MAQQSSGHTITVVENIHFSEELRAFYVSEHGQFGTSICMILPNPRVGCNQARTSMDINWSQWKDALSHMRHSHANW